MNSVAHLPPRVQTEFHRRRQCVALFKWLCTGGASSRAANEKARARYVSDGGHPITERTLRRWVEDDAYHVRTNYGVTRLAFNPA